MKKKEVTIKGSPLSFGLGIHVGQVDRVLNVREYFRNADVGSWMKYPGPFSAESL